MKKLSCGILMLGLLTVPCYSQKDMLELMKENFTLAEQQARNMVSAMSGYPDLLPRTIDASGKLITCNSSWWTSGFFPGTLWLLFEKTKDPKLRECARLFTAKIEKEKNNAGTHDLGFMLYNSFGNGLRLSNDPAYREVLLTGARSLISRFNPRIGCIMSWNPNAKWKYPVIIDNMMNLEFLMWAYKSSGDPAFRDIAVTHADTTIKNHFRKDYSSYHVVSYDPATGEVEKKQTSQGYADESSWARGQSWGLYGFVMMYRETGQKRYLDQAQHIAAYLINHPHLPADKVPYWDYDAPNIPNEKRDASAAAIMASALVELSGYSDFDQQKKYLEVAVRQIQTLSSPEYRAEPGTNGNFILKHSVGSIPGNSEVDVPLSYADYYFLEAMERLQGMKIGVPIRELGIR
jgi:unsaturated chondroitin disaccharide hydrolase